MKINDRHAHPNSPKKRDTTVSPSIGNRLTTFFATELKGKQAEADDYGQDIETLRQEIDVAGEKLECEPTLTNFKQFRELLSRLAKRINNEAYRLDKVGGTPMNPRYFEIITVIDKEADKLYELVVKEQKNRMSITAAVIGIKGLVVDLIT